MSAAPIVVTTDLSPQAIAAYALAKEESQLRNAPLIVLHVLDDWSIPFQIYEVNYPVMIEKVRSEISDKAKQGMKDIIEKHFQGVAVESAIVAANARTIPDSICEFVRERSAKMLITASQGRNAVAELVLGSVAHKIARTAPCPVVIVPAQL
jgi:nucleotide-binding universal stress UspA family protein